MKNWQTRWNDTINYLNTTFAGQGLGDHINTVVTKDKDKESISKELSIGKNPGKDGEDDPTEKSTKEQRHALRGLLLCQRVYYSDLWAKSTSGGGIVPWAVLGPSWKADSLKFWGGKAEKAVQQGIAVFLPDPAATADDLVAVAQSFKVGGKVLLPGNLTLSRANKDWNLNIDTCYKAVIAWLVQSGIMSMRWFMKDHGPTGEAALTRIFGAGKVVWDGKTPFLVESSKLPKVKKGHVLHMWATQSGPGGWNGHWLISNGDGSITAINNGEVKAEEDLGPEVQKPYTKTGSLLGQFLGYAGVLTKNDDKGIPQPVPGKYSQGNLVEWNPLKIPNRL